tara:strand:- start:519 stop:1379 length:861 start_codon:yes stop_codon:yes gene_type:complete
MEPCIAVCIHGRLGKSKKNIHGIPLDVIDSLKSLKNNVLDENKNNIFAHTWSDQRIMETFDFLKPNAYSITDPIEFKKLSQLKLYKYALKRGFKQLISYSITTKLNFVDAQKKLNNYMSRFYSHGATLHLMKNYALQNDIKYTHVLVSRYDLEFFSKFNFSKLKKEFIYIGQDIELFDKNNNNIPNRLYWEKLKNKEELRIENIDIFKRKRAIDDFFYVCSYENALAMANLFEKINYYLATGTPVSPHFLLERHIKEVIGMNNIKFCKKRMEDYDLSRRFRLGATI